MENMSAAELLSLIEKDVFSVFFMSLITFGRSSVLVRNLLISFMIREEHIRSIYEDDWIQRYLNQDFFLLFRMSKETFEKLLNVVQCPELQKEYHGGRLPVTSEKALLMTLWWLGKGESLNSIADRFDVAPWTVHHYTTVVVNRLVELVPRFIQWPNAEEMITIERQFEAICGYPGVIGSIDGSNVNFKAPVEQQDSYIDKNDKHSIKIQAVVTATRIFTNINVGFPGSVHDSRICTNSQLYTEVVNNIHQYFPLEEYHILGDKAYPLLGWMLTPFRDLGNLNRQQRVHNYKHSKTRMKVEHTFGIWKGRWRILKYINVNCPKKASKIIASCCVLHNFCYLNADEWIEDNDIENHENEDIDEDGDVVYVVHDNIGVRKRANIANMLV